jgi:hypothetical protein
MFPECFEDFFDYIHISSFIMALFNKVHLFLVVVSVENSINLLKRDETILFGGDKNAWTVGDLDSFLDINLVDVEISFGDYDRLDVLVDHVEKQLGKVCSLFAYFEEEALEGCEGTVKDGDFDGFAVETDVSESWVEAMVPVTAPMERPQRQNCACSLR